MAVEFIKYTLEYTICFNMLIKCTSNTQGYLKKDSVGKSNYKQSNVYMLQSIMHKFLRAANSNKYSRSGK